MKERKKQKKNSKERYEKKKPPSVQCVWCSGWVSLFRSSIGNNPISTKKSNTTFERKKIFTAQTYVQTVKTPAVMTKMKHLIGAPVVTSILSPPHLKTSWEMKSEWYQRAHDFSRCPPFKSYKLFRLEHKRQQEKVEETKLDKYKIGL